MGSLDAQGIDERRPHLGVHAINIYVRDQARSLRFYRDQLGFDLAFDAQLASGERWIAVAPPDGSALLNLIAPKPESREYPLIERPTGIVFVTEDVPVKYAEWLRRGVRFQYAPRLRREKYERQPLAPRMHLEGENPAWGGVFTHFKDPDGNSFALVGFDEAPGKLKRGVARWRRSAKRNAAPHRNSKLPNRCRQERDGREKAAPGRRVPSRRRRSSFRQAR